MSSQTNQYSALTTAELELLLVDETPFLDVRAEIEFAKGSFPTAKNIPILNTEERHQVGSCYKQQGQDKAIDLGHQLVSGGNKQRKIEAWSELAKQNPTLHLFCWRGGMRSHLAQQWLSENGVSVPLISGGYKALRAVLLRQFESVGQKSILLIGGKTGTAKTPLVNALNSGIDLEGLAHHRGSSFGRRVEEPPCQASFENALGIDILRKKCASSTAPLVFEDESRMIGPISIPLPLWRTMECASLAVVDMPLEFRIQRVLKEYVDELLIEHLAIDQQMGAEKFRQQLLSSLHRIRKRLGSQKYSKYQQVMNEAIDHQFSSGDSSYHREWISGLLTSYYDPMYEYQLEKKRQRIVFQGDYQQVKEWAEQANLSS